MVCLFVVLSRACVCVLSWRSVCIKASLCSSEARPGLCCSTSRKSNKTTKENTRWDDGRWCHPECNVGLVLGLFQHVSLSFSFQKMKLQARSFSTEIKQIDLDVNRTFRNHIMFRDRFGVKWVQVSGSNGGMLSSLTTPENWFMSDCEPRFHTS